MNPLNLNVLVLNKAFVPINVITVKKALKKLNNRRVEIISVAGKHLSFYNLESWADMSNLKNEIQEVDGTEDWIGAFGSTLEVPRIVRALNYAQVHRRKVILSRRNVFLRDNNTCQYCGKRFKTSDLELEHVNPRGQSGIDSWENLVCACVSCNNQKGCRTPAQAGMKLIRKPVKPAFIPDFRLKIGSPKYISWRTFLSEIYWNVELEGT